MLEEVVRRRKIFCGEAEMRYQDCLRATALAPEVLESLASEEQVKGCHGVELEEGFLGPVRLKTGPKSPE